MKDASFNFFLRWLAPLLVLTAAGVFIYAMGAKQKPNRKKAPPRRSIPVEVVRAVPHHGTLTIEASGVAVPFREVKLSAQVGGEVIFKAASLSPGHYVQKNEVLLKIDPATYKLEVERLNQEIAKAEQELSNIQVQAANAERLLQLSRQMVTLRKKDVDRLDRLKASSASAQETDAVHMAWLTTTEQMTNHENELRVLSGQAKTLQMTRDLVSVQLARAKLDLKRTTIVAPFSGVVIANHVEQNGSVVPGAAVATIEDTSMVEVRCSLRSDDLEFILQHSPGSSNNLTDESLNASESDVQTSASVEQEQWNPGNAYRLPATPVTISYERSGRQYFWSGTLSRQDGLGIDTKTRTMPVRILVSNPTGSRFESKQANSLSTDSSLADPPTTALLRGMFVKVKMHCETQQPFLSIPEAVVRPGKNIWVMRDGKLHVESIRIARIEDGIAFFDPQQCNVNATDQVISTPVPNARDGISVSIKKQKPGKQKHDAQSSGSQSSGAQSGGAQSANRQPNKRQSSTLRRTSHSNRSRGTDSMSQQKAAIR